MKDCFCVLLMGFIMISNLIGIYETRHKFLTPFNTSIIWDRDSLNRIVEARKVTITNSIITSIVNRVIDEANNAKTSYEWKDEKNIFDDSTYNTFINNLTDIFQNVTFEEYRENDRYIIRLDWT